MQKIWEQTFADLRLLVEAPILVPEMWWVVLPLIGITLVMTFYFGKYICEQLGWNSALSNSIVLLFVGLDLLRTIYHYTFPASVWNYAWHPVKLGIILFIMFEGMLLARMAFQHAVPSAFMFFIASPLSVNLQAYILTVLVYLQIEPTITVLYAALILFAVLYAALTVLKEAEHLLLYHVRPKKHPCPIQKKK